MSHVTPDFNGGQGTDVGRKKRLPRFVVYTYQTLPSKDTDTLLPLPPPNDRSAHKIGRAYIEINFLRIRKLLGSPSRDTASGSPRDHNETLEICSVNRRLGDTRVDGLLLFS